ncbi:oligosaccharide flippase family protein [Candidatus Roizmanbacteria bacterium]|nr:oligosaccharide flippase family protein [Candidatus Roizmanbacteria bacterium]
MRRHIKLYWSNEYVQGGIFLTLSAFMANALNYVFNFFAARVLGPSGYGELIAFYSYIALFSVPMVVLSNIIIQRISSHTASPYLYANSFAIQFRHILFRLLPFIGLSMLGIPFISRITNLSPVVSYLLIPAILLGIVSSFYLSIYQGLKLFFLFSLLGLASVVFKLASIAIPVFKYGALNEVLIFQFLSGVFIVFISFMILSKLLRNHIPKNTSSTVTKLKRFFSGSQFIITLFSVLSFTMLSNIDVMFVKKFFSSGETGIYSSWALFAKIILYVVAPLTQISFVFFAGNSKKYLQDRVLLITLGILVFVGGMGYFGYTYLGTFFISSLFGSTFQDVVPFLGLAAIFGMFYAAISFLNTYFLAKRSRYALILALLLPFYLITLFFLPKTLVYLMWTNIIFSALVAASYLGAFLLSGK